MSTKNPDFPARKQIKMNFLNFPQHSSTIAEGARNPQMTLDLLEKMAIGLSPGYRGDLVVQGISKRLSDRPLIASVRNATTPMVKTASPRLLRYLLSLSPAKRMSTVKSLPPDLRSTAAHKMLGRDAAAVTKRMPNNHGHGSEHVFAVTRNFQNAAQPNKRHNYAGMPLAPKRQGTIGALLHDVGRRYEDPVAARAGMKISKLSPHFWHSETGGRFAKRMIKNHPYAKFLPKDMGSNIRNMIRVHDTDAHKAFPQLTQRFLYDRRQGANRALYASDKQDGLGTMGALRTFQTGMPRGETVAETTAFALNKNVPKYQRVIDGYAMPGQRAKMHQQLTDYSDAMSRWNAQSATRVNPGSIPRRVEQLDALIPGRLQGDARARAMWDNYVGR